MSDVIVNTATNLRPTTHHASCLCSCASILMTLYLFFSEFLAPGAPCEVNVDGKTMDITQKALENPTR